MAAKPPAHTRATRQDWIDMALASLDTVPIDQLRVLVLAGKLDVSRSSFYWYFEDLDELRGELLTRWRRNTASIVERSDRVQPTIVAAILGVFECWADSRLYDSRLDLAVRDWGRRDPSMAERMAEADRVRLQAITTMFQRHGFDSMEALVRARLLYYTQVGYYAVGVDESMDDRVAYLPVYLESMAGVAPTADELVAFKEFVSVLSEDG